MSYSHFIRTFVFAATATVAVSLSATAAASQCKGLVENACSADTQCTWVDGYTRKDGRAVTAHCRKSPNNKAAAKKTSEMPRIGQLDR